MHSQCLQPGTMRMAKANAVPAPCAAQRGARTATRVATVDTPRPSIVEEKLQPVHIQVDSNQIVRQGHYEASLMQRQV